MRKLYRKTKLFVHGQLPVLMALYARFSTLLKNLSADTITHMSRYFNDKIHSLYLGLEYRFMVNLLTLSNDKLVVLKITAFYGSRYVRNLFTGDDDSALRH